MPLPRLTAETLGPFIRKRTQDRTGLSLEERRATMDKNAEVFAVGPDVAVERVTIAGDISAEWQGAPGASPRRVILYFHGGGYVTGSSRSHRHITSALSAASGGRSLSVDYRMAPEHPFPAAPDDGIAAYRWLLEEGYAANQVAIGGDSAGGGLALATLLQARDKGLPMPAAALLISPWADLTCSSETYRTRADIDPMITQAGIADTARTYLGEADARDPRASPVFADLRGLPPMLIQVGEAEVLLDDARDLASNARRAGVSASLEVWDHMVHVWHAFHPILDEGERAITRLGDFAAARWEEAQPSAAA